MIFTGKRGASSPAEAEKKKPDGKTTPSGGYVGRDAANKGYQPPMVAMEDWDGIEDTGDPWQEQSPTRRRRWSTGRSPGGTPPQSINSSSRTFSEAARQGARRYPNPDQSKPPGPNPDFLHKHTHPCFRMRNDGAFRDEIEIETRTINGEPFRGTITRKEGKHRIYKEIIGGPLSNFRGVRLGFKNVPTVVIMLKEPVNIDDLESIQEFDFKRKYTIKDKRTGEENQMEDTIGCKIRGVRTVTGSEASIPYSENWRRVIKIEGCDYRVEESTIISFLEHYGEVLSEMVEDVFEDDEDSDGVNATGIYSIKMRLTRNIPQMVPLDGRRIKFYYRNIQKQCTKCFGPHLGRNCANEKVAWIDYVCEFIRTNPHLERDLFGKWMEITARIEKQKEIDKAHYQSKQQQHGEVEKELERNLGEGEASVPNGDGASHQDERRQGSEMEAEKTTTNQNPIQEQVDPELPPEPKPSDFNLPETDEAINEVINKLVEFGMTNNDAVANMDKRRKLFNQALKKHASIISRAARKSKPWKGRRESQNDK